jgi:hypothetical protein
MILEHDLNNKNIFFSCSSDFSSEDIKTRIIVLYISMKNKSFSKSFINWVIDYALHWDVDLELSIVNKPYYSFYEWKRQFLNIEDGSELEILDKIHNDSIIKVKNILNQTKTNKVKFLNWDILSNQCPSWLKTEIQNAFKRKGKVYNLITSQTKKITSVDDNFEIEGKSQFMLSELPVLTWCYYNRKQGVTDIYPGENISYFNDLELGHLKDELPNTYKFVLDSSPLIYGNVKA